MKKSLQTAISPIGGKLPVIHEKQKKEAPLERVTVKAFCKNVIVEPKLG